MADQAITLNTGAALNGRVLARIGATPSSSSGGGRSSRSAAEHQGRENRSGTLLGLAAG
ncbi:hypothetical protein [Hyalangium sp.]|uniref:hypothetical protein n=1 Tax=Hyalangium sp. TaxID=2028555 RepID=UPI002D3A9B99|nr:hypothetical protein [Hyalangium sp.]HYH99497.1 hypothetical protein [Hyalangium sp.]